MTKMRKGQSRSFNNWLRLRIVAQGLTVAAVVAGSWAYGAAKATMPELDAAAMQDKAALERVAFEERLRIAEEITRAESRSQSEASSGPSQNVPATAVPTELPISSTRKSWWK